MISFGSTVLRFLRPSFLTYLSQIDVDIKNKVVPGFELTMINGQPATTVIGEYAKESGMSSVGSTESVALYSFFNRTLNIPDKATVRVELLSTDGKIFHINLPWFYDSKEVDAEAQIVLDKRKILDVRNVTNFRQYVAQQAPNQKLEEVIYDGTTKKLESSFYSDESLKEEGIYFDILNLKDKRYCYVKISTFSFDEAVLKNGDRDYFIYQKDKNKEELNK